MRIVQLACCMTMLSCGAIAQEWGPAQFLIGHWTGEGTGQPGAGTGEFSFTPDLQGKILTRHSFAEYPAAGSKPAFRHDDLMIVYHDDATRELHAIYFDSEDHIIRYAVNPVAGGVAFVSEGKPGEMRYRLTYTPTGKDALKLKFEVAPPGKDFAPYIDAGARRTR